MIQSLDILFYLSVRSSQQKLLNQLVRSLLVFLPKFQRLNRFSTSLVPDECWARRLSLSLIVAAINE